ncbi:hypothetical protein K492DRAFT_206207 [Lichtheimia hyalospora FSU 10163]|nr:hypothetical protein K492DRAFT_206207 [Lichtheimia hyalospora FSU 10163]
MLRRFHRPLGGFLLLIFLCGSCIRLLQPNLSSSSNIDTISSDESFITYAAHGDFLEQYKALRSGARLAFETNRTLLVPALHLSPPSRKNGSDIQDTEWLNDEPWIEIPWSKIIDIEAPLKEFGIRIRDKTTEPDASFVHWIHITKSSKLDSLKATESRTRRFTMWLQKPLASYPTTSSTLGTSPLEVQHINHLKELRALRERYVHCGVISSGVFKNAFNKERQQLTLHAAMSRHLLLKPDGLTFINEAAQTIIDKLGGQRQFNTLFLNLAKYMSVTTTSSSSSTSNGSSSSLSSFTTTITNATTTSSSNISITNQQHRRRPMTMTPEQKEILASFRRHLKKTKSHAMKDIASDILSTMSIDQSVAAAMPVQPKTSLYDHLPVWKSMFPERRQSLLDACLTYRRDVDPGYPILYLVSDLDLQSSTAALDIYRPLLDAFPCTFSKTDMYHWGTLDSNWWQNVHQVISARSNESNGVMDYNQVLSPLLNLMIGGQGYSHVEIPFSAMANTVISLQQANTTTF